MPNESLNITLAEHRGVVEDILNRRPYWMTPACLRGHRREVAILLGYEGGGLASFICAMVFAALFALAQMLGGG